MIFENLADWRQNLIANTVDLISPNHYSQFQHEFQFRNATEGAKLPKCV
jgi:hypothetical protein